VKQSVSRMRYAWKWEQKEKKKRETIPVVVWRIKEGAEKLLSGLPIIGPSNASQTW
jgi:lipid-A-disaccharide synthase-like uncharacterized protein